MEGGIPGAGTVIATSWWWDLSEEVSLVSTGASERIVNCYHDRVFGQTKPAGGMAGLWVAGKSHVTEWSEHGL